MYNLIHFFNEVGKLKFINRLGWILGGVEEEDTESIADHSFRLAIMGWFFAQKNGLDTEKVLKMSLVHDLCVVYTGDITPYGNLLTGDSVKDRKVVETWPRRSKGEKERLVKERREMEEKAVNKLITRLDPKFGREIKEVWLEYEEGRTKEGRFTRQLDRIEKLLQATEYKESKKYLNPLNPFLVQLKELVDDKELIEFIELLDDYYYSKKGVLKPKRQKRPTQPDGNPVVSP